MCCGLGAAVLLLLVVKHGPIDAVLNELGELEAKILEIQEQIAIKTDTKINLTKVLEETESNLLAASEKDEDGTETYAMVQERRLAALVLELAKQQDILRAQRIKLAEVSLKKSEEQSEEKTQVSKTHLTGLLVNGDRVVILLDVSASMLATSLVEIIRIRASPTRIKQNAEKWLRARRAAYWVYDKIPPKTQYQLITFSDAVEDADGVSASAVPNFVWKTKDDNAVTAERLRNRLDQIIPHGPTDLMTALNYAGSLSPKPLQIILITDGLPTKPGTRTLARLRDCPRTTAGKTVLLSPNCRASVFRNSVSRARSRIRDIRVDTILFPLEGDSNAIHHYWELAQSSGGRVLSPISSWP